MYTGAAGHFFSQYAQRYRDLYRHCIFCSDVACRVAPKTPHRPQNTDHQKDVARTVFVATWRTASRHKTPRRALKHRIAFQKHRTVPKNTTPRPKHRPSKGCHPHGLCSDVACRVAPQNSASYPKTPHCPQNTASHPKNAASHSKNTAPRPKHRPSNGCHPHGLCSDVACRVAPQNTASHPKHPIPPKRPPSSLPLPFHLGPPTPHISPKDPAGRLYRLAKTH